MDTFFTGLLLAMVPFIVIVVVALIVQRNQQKEKKETEEFTFQEQEILNRQPTEKSIVLARRTISILSPYIGKFDEDIADEGITKIWDAIKKKFDIPESYSSASEFANYGTDQEVRDAFEIYIHRAIQEDAQFAEEIEKLLRKTQLVIGTDSSQVGGANIVISGDVSGQVSIGDNYISNRLAGDETTDAPPPEKKKKSGGE